MAPSSQFIDIGDVNAPIYRVFSNTRLLEMFRDRKLALSAPRLWDDPFENSLASCRAFMTESNAWTSLSGVFRNFFGQCWTHHRDSDAMWRIYSGKKKNGGRVRTTPQRLLDAIYDPHNDFATMSYFIGEVQYLEEQAIRDAFVDGDFTARVALDQTGHNHAVPLLIKRTEFQHEAEVRLLFRYNRAGYDGTLRRNVWKFDIDPCTLFDEVVFDPRISDAQLTSYKQELTNLGFSRPIERSPLYKVANLRVRIKA